MKTAVWFLVKNFQKERRLCIFFVRNLKTATGSLLPDGSRSRLDQRDKNKYCYGALLSPKMCYF